MNTRNMLISAGIAGGVMGLLSGIPGLNLGNCLLCLWVWVGGILAVYLYNRSEPVPPSGGQGAILGALSGLVGAIVSSILWLVFGAAMTSMTAMVGDVTSDEAISSLVGQGITSVFWLLLTIVLYPGIGALAGLIGVEMFAKSRSMPPGV